ncbi:hypothetical protein DMJ13_21390 [halophilic archaeon]|nr:hypothetical protein DMJ13_21390 [halophilic archaeon]
MVDFVVHLEEQAILELNHLNVGVEQDLIAFDISGTIQGIDDELLAEMAGTTLIPTEIHFVSTDE